MRKDGKVFCNSCKRELTVEQGYVKEGCVSSDIAFGYFSNKDGKRHRFDLCEKCYDEIVGRFLIPVEETEETELL